MVKLIDNVSTILRDDLAETIKAGDKVSIAAAYFSMYTYRELKKQLEGIDEFRLPLSLPYFAEQIEGFTIHTYNDGDLIACFDENVPDSVIKTIANRKPLRAVFRDSSFANSPAKINVGEIFKLLAPDTRVKVI